ncbi:hypothetical protein [Desertibacillus haloalkaliphilus]|uniref:hypothetical protein n=1 Tax=Desertibacillus haloalkaliphilus TaxID=1328930 RepID=UPI001C27DA89|nr:hypothetical protein [Desertibacillus haloalkaliphilus]MBU8908511.1 hypothetical protein [Desertibacillus haloalkaliphilus]
MNQKRYIVKGEKPHRTWRNGHRVVVKPGESFVPTDAELKAFGDKFVLEIANVSNSGKGESVQKKVQDIEGLDQEDVDQYHAGGGYYELPDGEKVRGKENAMEALKQLNNKDGE